MNDSDRLVRQLLQLPNSEVDAIVATWHRERQLRDKGAGTSPALGDANSVDQTSGRLARETEAHVGAGSAYTDKQAMPMDERAGNGADVQHTKGVDQMQQPLSHQLRQLANTSHVAHLAAHALERLEQRQAKRRAELEGSQLVPRLMAAAWNAMQVNRRQPIPVWLAELVDLTREAAGVLLEDTNIPTQGPKL
jgi:hypothetical protein